MSNNERDVVCVTVFTVFMLFALAFSLMFFASRAHAMEGDGHSMSPHKEWFDSLKNQQGNACCSDADGTALIDADWKSDANGKYWVRIEGEWHVVPDIAVLKGPNKDGRTIVWPLRGVMGLTIRCFIVGTLV